MRYWCLNFSPGVEKYTGNECSLLNYGFKHDLWAMQYQYAHGLHDYQGNENQRGAIALSWGAISGIAPGDWCAAWLPPRRFYAIGKAVKPRQSATYVDRVERTLGERRHIHLDGVVYYEDSAGAFYECFTDSFSVSHNRSHRCRYCLDHPGELEVMKFPQRIDVDKWEPIVRQGVEVQRMAPGVEGSIRAAPVRVADEFFESIRVALQQAANGVEPPRVRRQNLGGERLRIRLEAYDHEVLDRAAHEIVETAQRTGALVHGPIPLPTRVERYTVLRSPHIDGKCRKEFEIRTHKRMLDILQPTNKTIEALNKGLSLPPGVDIKIRVLTEGAS